MLAARAFYCLDRLCRKTSGVILLVVMKFLVLGLIVEHLGKAEKEPQNTVGTPCGFTF